MRILEPGQILVASHNAGKVAEIRGLMEPLGFTIRSAAELGLEEPAETGTTFEENAFIKAQAAARAAGVVALSDDSGLCVDALGGRPGVHTADWAEKPDGSGRDFFLAMEKVENALQEAGAVSAEERTGRFVAVLCLCWPDGHGEYFRGEVEGRLVWPPRGDKGFGYDPVFLPEGHARTFGEMSAGEKHGWTPGSTTPALSHRARAFEKLVHSGLVGGASATAGKAG